MRGRTSCGTPTCSTEEATRWGGGGAPLTALLALAQLAEHLRASAVRVLTIRTLAWTAFLE